MSFGEAMRKAMDSETIKPPKGPYKVAIESGSAYWSKDDVELCKIILKITEGELEGAQFEHFMYMKTDAQKEIAANSLAGYGIDWTGIDSLEDLDKAIPSLIGTRAEVSVSYGGNEGQFLNVNVHRSWPPEPVSDVPSSPSGFERTPEQQATFASAAQKFGDEPAF